MVKALDMRSRDNYLITRVELPGPETGFGYSHCFTIDSEYVSADDLVNYFSKGCPSFVWHWPVLLELDTYYQD